MNYWTLSETNLLRDNYTKHTYDEMSTMIFDQFDIVRTPEAVKKKGRRLGLSKRWTEDERHIVAHNPDTPGLELVEMLRNRRTLGATLQMRSRMKRNDNK